MAKRNSEKSLLELSYRPMDKRITIRANVAKGWKRYPYDFGYWGTGKEKLDSFLSITVKVTIFGRRNRPAAEWPEFSSIADVRERAKALVDLVRSLKLERFPDGLIHEWHDDTMNYRISEGVLDVYINLGDSEDNFSISEKGNPYLNWDDSIIDDGAELKLTVNVVFTTSSRRPGNIREWNTVFASAGLPGLGKRR